MKNLIFVLSILFVITTFNQEVYSQKRMHRNTENFQMNMREKLNLTDEQLNKIENLRLSHQEMMIKLRTDLELKELEMRKIKSSDKMSRGEVIRITKEINAIKDEMALVRANHQMDVYDNLDENQRKIWADRSDGFGCMKNNFRDKLCDRRNWQ